MGSVECKVFNTFLILCYVFPNESPAAILSFIAWSRLNTLANDHHHRTRLDLTWDSLNASPHRRYFTVDISPIFSAINPKKPPVLGVKGIAQPESLKSHPLPSCHKFGTSPVDIRHCARNPSYAAAHSRRRGLRSTFSPALPCHALFPFARLHVRIRHCRGGRRWVWATTRIERKDAAPCYAL